MLRTFTLLYGPVGPLNLLHVPELQYSSFGPSWTAASISGTWMLLDVSKHHTTFFNGHAFLTAWLLNMKAPRIFEMSAAIHETTGVRDFIPAPLGEPKISRFCPSLCLHARTLPVVKFETRKTATLKTEINS